MFRVRGAASPPVPFSAASRMQDSPDSSLIDRPPSREYQLPLRCEPLEGRAPGRRSRARPVGSCAASASTVATKHSTRPGT